MRRNNEDGFGSVPKEVKGCCCGDEAAIANPNLLVDVNADEERRSMRIDVDGKRRNNIILKPY